MKPDWKDAPEWAKFLAMDKDGTWHWYQEELYPDQDEGQWMFFGAHCRYEIAGKQNSTTDDEWKATLEPRP